MRGRAWRRACGGAGLLAAVLSGGAGTAQDVAFKDAVVEACFARDDARSCIGDAAAVCMEVSEGGFSTVAMGGCLSRELQVWDRLLNAEYGRVVAFAQARDADRPEGFNVPAMEPALREMQRDWIAFRDSSCTWERVQWGGGTGGGPATNACLLRMTAEQAIFLKGQGLGDGQ